MHITVTLRRERTPTTESEFQSQANVPATANRLDDARADIHSKGVWGQQQCVFFGQKEFYHLNPQSYHYTSIPVINTHQ